MKKKPIALAAAVAAMAAAPIAANANAAERASAPTEDAQGLGGSGLIIGVLAAAAVIAGIIIIADDGNDNPVSA